MVLLFGHNHRLQGQLLPSSHATEAARSLLRASIIG